MIITTLQRKLAWLLNKLRRPTRTCASRCLWTLPPSVRSGLLVNHQAMSRNVVRMTRRPGMSCLRRGGTSHGRFCAPKSSCSSSKALKKEYANYMTIGLTSPNQTIGITLKLKARSTRNLLLTGKGERTRVNFHELNYLRRVLLVFLISAGSEATVPSSNFWFFIYRIVASLNQKGTQTAIPKKKNK